MLDIEYNPSGATCYGLSASAMVNWIQDFVNTYYGSTGRYPIIYSTNDWWSTCTVSLTSSARLWVVAYKTYYSNYATLTFIFPSQGRQHRLPHNLPSQPRKVRQLSGHHPRWMAVPNHLAERRLVCLRRRLGRL